MSTLLRLAVITAVSCLPALAQAVLLRFDTPLGLSGAQEIPARATSALGSGSATYDTDTFLLHVQLSWSGLLAAPSAAHIHCCSGPAANGPVAIDFVGAGFPSLITGSYDHVFNLDATASYGGAFLNSFGGDVDLARDAFVNGISSNLAYFNIHTSVFPGGEIRGNIVQIPEPATLALLGMGLAAAALLRRRPVPDR